MTEVFNLGFQPYANSFAKQTNKSAAPLVLMQCPNCSMVQLQHVADCRDLFREYSFMTGQSARMAGHFAALMNENAAKYVPPGGLIVEIGSNDGTALAGVSRSDIRKLGVDPAQNIAEMAIRRGVKTIPEFFSEQVAAIITAEYGKADLIVACNVLGHIDDLDSVFRGIRLLLTDIGAVVFEVPYVRKMVNETEFDTIYHEHLSYFNIKGIAALLSRHGMFIEHIKSQTVHGGTVRITARRAFAWSTMNENTLTWLENEVENPLDWGGFSSRCRSMRANLHAWLIATATVEKRVWAYGAAAKGTVMLNFCGIGEDLIPAVVDSTPLKQNLRVPGMGQMIVPASQLYDAMPDYVLILAWNHANEIMRKESRYVQAGGRFVTPHAFIDGMPK